MLSRLASPVFVKRIHIFLRQLNTSKHYPLNQENANFELNTNNVKKHSEKLISVDGISINVLENGEGDHTVLCLPGLLGTIATDFGTIFQNMSTSKFRLVCWDPPGYGKSRPYKKSHEGDYYSRDAQIAVQLMNKLGYDKFSVLGWSNGGITGNALAVNFPERVNKLIMFATLAYCNDESFPQNKFVTNTKNWSPQVLKAMLQIYEETYLEETLKDYHEHLTKLYASGNTAGIPERYPKIQCPTLVIHGEMDPIVWISHAQYFVKNIQNCQMRVIEGGRHNLHMTHTTEFVKVVEEFLLS